jgi:hypothetical protein
VLLPYLQFGESSGRMPAPQPGCGQRTPPDWRTSSSAPNLWYLQQPGNSHYSCTGTQQFDHTFSIGSRIQIFPARIPDSGSKDSGSAPKNLSIFNPKKSVLSSWKYNPGCSSRNLILCFYPSLIQGSKRHRNPDPGYTTVPQTKHHTKHQN